MNNFDISSFFKGKTIKKISKDTNKTTSELSDKTDKDCNKTTDELIEKTDVKDNIENCVKDCVKDDIKDCVKDDVKEKKEEINKSDDKTIEDIRKINSELIVKLTNLSIEYIKILRNYKNLLGIKNEGLEEKEILSMFKQYSIDENELMTVINQKIISTEEKQIDENKLVNQKITSTEEKHLNKILDSPKEDKIKLSFKDKEILIDKNSMYILINQIRNKEYYVYQGYANNFYNVIQDQFFENGVEVIETNAQKHNELMLNFNKKGIIKRLGPSLYEIEDLDKFVEKYKKHIK